MIERACVPAFSLARARYLVRDLFTPNPVIYWADFLASIGGGMLCFTLVRRRLEPFSVAQGIAFLICCLLFYRATLFTHELTHLRSGSFRVFRIVWNLLCGIPFLMPSFMYYTHVEHHMRKHFGTDHDGEYLPLGTTSPWHILAYLCQPFVIPIITVVRFLILSPISWVSPRLRDFIHHHASSMVMDPTYIRPLPTRAVLRIFRLQEALCFLWCVGLITVMSLGIVPPGFLPTAYAVSVVILFLNAIRTLGAHRYTNAEGQMTFIEQMLDSINYPRWPFVSALWAPVGLRFHALHHLFPSLPYHNLAKAHARLMAELPADSPYRITESRGLWTSLKELYRHSQASTKGNRPATSTSIGAGNLVRPSGHAGQSSGVSRS
jgi:fatty acid desaturase